MNAAVVGFGSIGPVHAQVINQCENAVLYGICDVDRQRAQKGAEEYNCKAFDSFDAIICDENVDVVHICTPHYLHYDMITKALDTGKKVVCEKPAVMTKKELDLLYSAYDTKKIFPIIQNRTNYCIKELEKKIKEDGKTGKLKGIKAIMTWGRDASYYSRDNWHGTKQYEGGGVLINQAFHTLDLMMLFGGKTKSVISSTMNHSLEGVIDVEDTVNAFIKFENGAKGVFFATNAYTRDSAVELEIHFENKTFLYQDGKLFADKELVCEDSQEYIGKKCWGSGHYKTLYDYYDNSSKLCLDDVKNTMETLFAIYESAEKQSEILI